MFQNKKQFRSPKKCYSGQLLGILLLFLTIVYTECRSSHPSKVNFLLLEQLKGMTEYDRNPHLLQLVQQQNITITEEIRATIANETKFRNELLEAFIKDLAESPSTEFEAKLNSLQLLFDLQPDLVDAKIDFYQQTPLHLAAQLDFPKRMKILQMLIANGANVNSENIVGYTALSWAVVKTPTPPDLINVIKLLIDNGANPNERYGPFRLTFVHLVAERHSSKLLHETVTYLQSINNTWSLRIEDRFGGLVLHYALKYAKYEVGDETLEIFNSSGTNFNAVNEMDDDGSVLETGIKYGKSVHLLKSLIRFGANWRERNWKGDTPLYVAVKHGNLPAFKLFVELGADVNAKADRSDYCILARTILNRTSEEYISTLIGAGANWYNMTDNWNITALHLVSSIQNLAALQVLISVGADVNAKEDIGGNTPLHAVFSKEVAYGIDGTKPYWDEEVAYHLVTKLVEAGADVNERNGDGYLAIDFARNSTFSDEQIKSSIFKLLEPTSLPIANLTPLFNLDKMVALFCNLFVTMQELITYTNTGRLGPPNSNIKPTQFQCFSCNKQRKQK